MAKVLVTGGSGYVAGWCIYQLLEAGHDVVATVRSTMRAESAGDAVAPGVDSADRLRFVIADLTSPGGWDEAMDGCDYVLHTASPLSDDDDAPERVIGPAVDGTRCVLAAAMAAGVKRVVMTSSCAAATPLSTQLSGVVDESCWTDADEPGLAAYRRSKALAERAAWDLVGESSSSTELTTILPAAVFGPSRSIASLSSLRIIAGLLDGSTPALARLGFEVVDVRDVAVAHLLAMTSPAAAGGRFIVSGELLWLQDIAGLLRTHLGSSAARVATELLPDDVVRSLAESMPQLRTVLPLLGRELIHSSARAHQILGWDARPANETIIDSANYLLGSGVL
jgi:nucleoside-diphosphate-sugar epimerase